MDRLTELTIREDWLKMLFWNAVAIAAGITVCLLNVGDWLGMFAGVLMLLLGIYSMVRTIRMRLEVWKMDSRKQA